MTSSVCGVNVRLYVQIRLLLLPQAVFRRSMETVELLKLNQLINRRDLIISIFEKKKHERLIHNDNNIRITIEIVICYFDAKWYLIERGWKFVNERKSNTFTEINRQ